MGHRQDDPYKDSPWGMDTRRHPGEQQWIDDMKGGADERPLYVAPQDQALIDATSADNECPHERLPGDPSPPCGCWDVEQEAPGGASAEVARVSVAPPSGPPAERPEAA